MRRDLYVRFRQAKTKHCHPERSTSESEGESKDPEDVSITMLCEKLFHVDVSDLVSFSPDSLEFPENPRYRCSAKILFSALL
jgi:hypothetical protein